jgi:hypothetical protein
MEEFDHDGPEMPEYDVLAAFIQEHFDYTFSDRAYEILSDFDP